MTQIEQALPAPGQNKPRKWWNDTGHTCKHLILLYCSRSVSTGRHARRQVDVT